MPNERPLSGSNMVVKSAKLKVQSKAPITFVRAPSVPTRTEPVIKSYPDYLTVCDVIIRMVTSLRAYDITAETQVKCL
jgi:hypothetical protein